MKVLHVLNTGSYSGAENVIITIINHLKKDPSIECVYVSLYGDIGERLRKENIAYYPVEKLSVANLKRAFQDLQPDIIHAHDFTASILTAFCFPKAKVISHIHNNSPWIQSFNANSIAFLLASLLNDQILTVSNAVEEEYIFSKFIHKKIKCIGNPIDLKAIREKANAKQASEHFDVLFLGRLTEQKNPPMIVSVFEKLCKLFPHIQIGIIGTGDQADYFHEHLDSISQVRFYGFLENPYPIVKNSKILFMPSKWEGYGLVAVEALSLGLPVVCSGAGGLKNIVNDACGLIASKENDYINEIEKLLKNQSYYEEKSKNAIQRAEQINNIDEYMKTIDDLYHRLAK